MITDQQEPMPDNSRKSAEASIGKKQIISPIRGIICIFRHEISPEDCGRLHKQREQSELIHVCGAKIFARGFIIEIIETTRRKKL